MDVDIRRIGWPQRAACRWVAYSALWATTAVSCGLASGHAVVASVGALLGCALAASLPLVFATLFEATYSRRAKADVPLICCPCLGSVVVLIGTVVLIEASSYIVGTASHAELDSAKELCSRFAGVPQDRLPRTVCIRHAFIQTGWEAGKLRCEETDDGRVECKAAYAAAPIFDGEALAEAGLPDEIWAWAVVRGRHVDASYRRDGTLCGYLSGPEQLDFWLGDFRLAVRRVVEKRQLRLQQPTAVAAGEHSGGTCSNVALADRPLVLAIDPSQATPREQALLVAAVILLCFCPCVGPVPLGFVFLYWCWARSEDQYSGRHMISPDDLDEDLTQGF